MRYYFVALNGIEEPFQSDPYTDAVTRNAAAKEKFREMIDWNVLCVDVNSQGEISTTVIQSYDA